MQNLFGGLRTGPIAWLFEVDLIIDDAPGSESVDSVAGLAEGNWLFRKGHNLKISFDYYDPNRDIAITVSEDGENGATIYYNTTKPLQSLAI